MMQISGAKIPSTTVQGTLSEGGKVLFDRLDIEVFSPTALSFSGQAGLRGMFLLPAQKFLVPGFYDLDLKAGTIHHIVIKELCTKGRKDIYAMFGEVQSPGVLVQGKSAAEHRKIRHGKNQEGR